MHLRAVREDDRLEEEMERNQFWLFFGFALLLGLAAAAYQHAQGLAINAPYLHSRLEDEGPMYSGNDHMHLGLGYDGNSSFARVAGFISHLPIHLDNGEKIEKPVVKAAVKIDPKKKKDDKKKKTAQAKIAPGLKGLPGSNPNGDQIQALTGNDGSGAAAPSAGGTQAAGAGGADNGLPKTLAEWQKYILTTPNTQHTQFMIQMYQSSLLTADIYFQILGMMIADTRDQMRTLGVLVAGSAPSSNSFNTLLNEATSIKEVSNVRAQAQSYLRTYAQLVNIKYLLSVFSQNASSSSVSVALNLLQIAVKPYIAVAANAAATNVKASAETHAAMASYQMQQQIYINEQNAQGQEQVYNENGQLVNTYNEASSDPRMLAAASTSLTPTQVKLNKYFLPFVSVTTILVKQGSTAAIRTSATTVLAMLNQVVTIPTPVLTTPASATLTSN